MAATRLQVDGQKSVVPLIAVLTVVAVCLGLGFWQLDRADQKRSILAQRLAQAEADVRYLPGNAELIVAEPRTLIHAPVQITGEWLGKFEILLDNQVHSGRAGCHVLTPMKIDGSESVVLINRGWVPWGPDRSSLPRTSVSEGQVSVRGRVWLPAEGGFRLGAERETQSSAWRRLWQNLDLDLYASELGTDYELLPFVVRMDADNDGQKTAADSGVSSERDPNLDSSDQTDGYRRDWFAPTDLWIHRHLGYAVQWFGLGAIAIILYWIRRRKIQKSSATR